MEPTRTHLVQVPGVHLAHLESSPAAPSSPQLELVGTLDLFLCRSAQGSTARASSPGRRVPPPPPVRPADQAPPSTLAPPPRSTSASPSSSSSSAPPSYSSTSASGWKGTLAATLTAVNTVADHLEAGGKTLLDSGSKSASQVIHHKYGAEARGLADDVGSSVKHVALVYVDARGVTRKALLKGIGKGAIKAQLSDGSQVYLSGDGDELKQLEAAAAQGQGRIEGAQGAGAGQGGSRTGAIEAAPAYEDRAARGRYGDKQVRGEKW